MWGIRYDLSDLRIIYFCGVRGDDDALARE